MLPMQFDCRDLFKSARLAFSFQRLWLQFTGMFVGYLIYVILTYIALLTSGESFGILWSHFGLLPCIFGYVLKWYGWLIFGVGVFCLLIAWLVSSTAVARAAYMNLKGNTFYTWKEAFRFALIKKGKSVIATPVAIFVIIFFMAVGGVVVGLLGRIPVVGEIGLSFFAILWFLVSLFIVFLVLALIVSLLITPSVLATTDDDAFEGIFQSFSTLFSQPWRLILYEILTVLLSVIGLGVFALLAKKAWLVMTTVLSWGMGDKYIDISYAASYLIQNWVYPAVIWAKTLVGDIGGYFFFAHDFSSTQLSATMTVSSWILAVIMTIIMGFILCYPLAIFNVGNTLTYLVIKKKKDDENLLERKDREEEDEEEEETSEEDVKPNKDEEDKKSEESPEEKK